MTNIPFSSLFTLFPCFVLLLVSCIITIPLPSQGLKIALVPPHSPESPAYLGNLSLAKKIQKLVTQSKGRAQALSNSLFPITNLTQASPYDESKVVFRPPVSGIDPGGVSGYVFAAKIGIGTFSEEPHYKTYYLSLDTGSTLTWLQCEDCKKAGNNCFEQVDPHFQNSLSYTYTSLKEDSNMCNSAPPNPNPNNLCYYKLTYGDGSKSNGIMATDTFFFESDSLKIVEVPQMVFGCGFNQTDFPFPVNMPEKTAGIMGLGKGKEAFHVQLDFDNQVGLRFSYCFPDLLNQESDNQSPTYLRFEEDIHDDPSTFQETPFEVGPGKRIYYARLFSIRMGDEPSVLLVQDRVIIDSGSTVSCLFKPVYEAFEYNLRSWLEGRMGPPTIARGKGSTFCFVKRPDQGYEILPTIHFMFEGGGDFEIKPQQSFIVMKYGRREYFCLMIEPDDKLSIIGAYQQVNHRLIYDTKQNKLMFKNEDCVNNP